MSGSRFHIVAAVVVPRQKARSLTKRPSAGVQFWRSAMSLRALAISLVSIGLAHEHCWGQASAGNTVLGVTVRPQETSMWCWAASGQMVMESFGKTVKQCDQANNRLGLTDCCNNPTPVHCVKGGWPEFGKYGFTFKTTSNAPLSWAEVCNQIQVRQKPFAFTWHWSGG